jgi:hypothetical protein
MNSAWIIIAQSADLMLTAADVNKINNFVFETPPTCVNEDFYVGLYLYNSTTTCSPMAYMRENPQRTDTYYLFYPSIGTHGAAANGYKWIIEAQVAPVQSVIPALNNWGLVLLGLALLGAGTLFLFHRS